MFYVLPCVILFLCFSVLLALRTSLGEERPNPSAFRTFARFVCLVLSVSSLSWCLGWAAVCDWGSPWTFLLPFLISMILYFSVVTMGLIY